MKSRKTTLQIYKKGFSLIELFTVIGIITIISTITLVNTSTFSAKARVEAAASQILDIMKEIRHNSVSVREFKNNLFPSYGVYFDINFPRRIIVYADCLIDDSGDNYIDDNDNFTYNPSSTNCGGENGFVKEIALNSHVRIKEMRSISFGVTNTESKFYLEYVRPEPTVWITDSSGNLLPAGKIEIDLIDTKEKFKKTIVFWTTGQFAIQ
jgi:prepilin-type N-terminal cleavage/methylation domain-containing protein